MAKVSQDVAHHHWRREYREHRYGEHLTQAELNQRIRDIVLNLTMLKRNAKVGLPDMDPAGQRWMVLWTHLLEEMVLRHGPYPNGFTRDILHLEPIPNFVGDLAKKAAASIEHSQLQRDNVLIKYGRPDHMTSLYQGSMRISSAGSYKNKDHNGAVRDDELSFTTTLTLTRDQILPLVSNPTDVPQHNKNHRLDIEHRADRDFWIYCVTQSVEPRIFVDFNAYACVVIQDRAEFSRRMREATDVYFPNTKYREGRAVYVDPLLSNELKIDIPLTKHIRYAYQDEYRYIWWPAEQAQDLQHVDLEIGSLEDIAELIIL